MRHTPQNSFSKLVLLNERTSTVLGSKKFRYGYQGSEMDNEVKGDGNSYTTEFRQYDPRIGRWLSIDPLSAKFPWQSPYVAFDNNPVINSDPRGGEAENEIDNPGKRRRKLTMKRANELMRNGNSKKADRINEKIQKLNIRISGGNFGVETPKKANFDRRGGDAGEETLDSHTFESSTIMENGGFNLIGFKAAKINSEGHLEVFQVGTVMDGAETTPIPYWPKGNEYGQPEGSRVIVDDGNILDKDGNILIPKLKGVDSNDGLYQKGEISASGKVLKEDGIIRLELTKEYDSSGKVVRTDSKDIDITPKVKKKINDHDKIYSFSSNYFFSKRNLVSK